MENPLKSFVTILISLSIIGCTQKDFKLGECFESYGSVYKITHKGQYSIQAISKYNNKRLISNKEMQNYEKVDCFDNFN